MKINGLINTKYSNYINSYYVTGDAIEIISNKANKSQAIKVLKEKLNIKKSDIYTIGDGYSDIEMVRDFKGFNMVNSVKELKNVSIGEYKSVSDFIGDVINEKI